MQVPFGDTASRRCCGVSIVGDLRNAVTGVVQDLLLGGHTSTLDNLTYTKPNFKIFLGHETYNFLQLLELKAILLTKLTSAVMSYLLGHLMRVVQRVLPLQEHPLLLRAGQATGQPRG